MKEEAILFIVLPGKSHYHSMWGLLDYYSSKGYKVYATVNIENQNYIKHLGYEPIVIDYYQEYMFFSFKTFLKSILLSLISNEFSIVNRYRKLVCMGLELNEMIKLINPVQVFIDAHLSFYAIFFYKLKDRIKVIETKLLTTKHKGIPPLYVEITVKNNRVYAILTELYWIYHGIKVYVRCLLNNIAFGGFSENKLIRIYAEKKGMKGIFEKERNCSFNYLELNNEFEKLIVGPQSIEYPWRILKENERIALESNTLFKGIGVVRNETLKNWLFKFEQKKKMNSHCILIYCSFGSRDDKLEYLQKFLTDLTSVVEDTSNWFLVISSRIQLEDINENNPKSVIKIDYAPQYFLLSKCDIMITHAGANSINECLRNKIMMLLLPVDTSFDQPGNAARAVYHNFGIKYNIQKISRNKIKMLIQDTLEIR